MRGARERSRNQTGRFASDCEESASSDVAVVVVDGGEEGGRGEACETERANREPGRHATARDGKRNDRSFESPKRDDATRRRDFDRVFKRLPRRGERHTEREREREGGGGREHVRICKSERRGEAESKRARGGIERTATPAARTTSPLLASRRSASPRLASPTVNHLRCPVPKVRQSRSSMRDSRALRLVLHGHERKKNDGKRKKE